MSFRTRCEIRKLSKSFAGVDSMTEQSHKHVCDVHSILERYQRTGVVDHNARYQGMYMDCISAPDFEAAMNSIAAVTEMFESLPSHLRDRFRNDPRMFLEFIQDSSNRDEMLELGFSVEHLEGLEDVRKETDSASPVGDDSARVELDVSGSSSDDTLSPAKV